MALTATATQGMEFVRRTTDHEVLWIPGDPGDTFTRGDSATMTEGEGVLDIPTAGQASVATVLQTTVCPASTTAFPFPRDFDPVDRSGSNLCLVPVRPNVAAGTPIYRVTFVGHLDDENIAAYTAATPSITLNVGAVTDDDVNGAFVYIYGGPGQGQVNVVADYANATQVTTTHRIFGTPIPTTASDVIVLGGDTATFGVGPFGRFDMADQDNATVDNVATPSVAEFAVFMSWGETARELSNLSLLCIPAAAMYSDS